MLIPHMPLPVILPSKACAFNPSGCYLGVLASHHSTVVFLRCLVHRVDMAVEILGRCK